MSHAGKAATPSTDVGDSAPTVSKDNKNTPSKGGGKGPPSSKKKTESSSSKSTPGFAEGNAALLSYGLSVSGFRERVLSPFKTEKFFHIVSTSYQGLLTIKPSLAERFSYEEFLHCTALQLYQRIENVKFDALGMKPPAPLRIPLPRNLRVFQPIWSILANIGTVDDDELGVSYIPDAILPNSADLDTPHDIEGLLACTMYDWKSSWGDVQKARKNRSTWKDRDGYTVNTLSNETPRYSKDQLISEIASKKRNMNRVARALDEDIAKQIGSAVYMYPSVTHDEHSRFTITQHEPRPQSDFLSVDDVWYDVSLSDAELEKTEAYKTPDSYKSDLDALFVQAKLSKKERITPRFDTAYQASSYKISDGTVSSNPGAYGAWLHWDPQLWLDYENFVNEVSALAMFSLSMPIETTGTYAWLIPVEKRSENESAFCCKLPKASVPTQTWILALLLQSSTLPFHRRATWYKETDYLTNLTGLRQRYIQAAIKAGAPVNQFGTY